MIYVIIALVVVLGVLPALAIGYVLTKDGIARQKRIGQMKRFRKSSRTQKVAFTDKDKRTLV